MDRSTELELTDELLALKAENKTFLDETVARNSVEHYTCPDRLALERTHIFRKLPTPTAHITELPEAGSFVCREIAGLPVLITRNKVGEVKAFLNVCRHRGTRLVDEETGCKHRFSCPYHAWTYANSGELIAAPHFEQGFPDEKKADLGLKPLECVEMYGLIWVRPSATGAPTIQDHLASLAEDLTALKIDTLAIAAEHTEVRRANWKILVEGGIEAYHFKVAHRKTIGPYFEDNLSSYRAFGPHLRSILPRTTMANLTEDTREAWQLRDHANILYTLFPTSSFLVQQDHIAWITQEPVSPAETRIRIATLVPRSEIANTEHWERNHAITSTTLAEDFDIGESIQATLASGANSDMLFGRFEGALDQFNRTVAAYLEQ